MPIAATCLQCGRELNAADRFAGKRIRCPDCAAPVAIPARRKKRKAAAWHARLSDGRELGPCSQRELEALVAAGQIDAQSQIWQEGWDEARWASELWPALAPPAAVPRHAPAAFGPMLGALPPMPERPRPPRPPRPKRRPLSGPIELSPIGWATVATVTLLMLSTILTLAVPPLGVLLCGVLLLAGGAVLVGGHIWGIAIAFDESSETGLLFLFVPFYSIYYTFTRWEDMSRPFMVLLLGVTLLASGAGMLLLAALGNSIWSGAASSPGSGS